MNIEATMPVHPALGPLVDLADARFAQLVQLMQPVATFGELTDYQRQVLGWLSSASVRASGSAFVLLTFGKVWDAEIVSRSVFEGTLKFCHLLSDREHFASRFAEYEQALPDIGALADHDKVKRLIEAMPDIDENFATPMRELLLTEAQRDEITARYPRDVRRRLQMAWGFSGLIEQMVRSGKGMGKLASGLLHGYAMASHVAHADFRGSE